MTTPGIEAAFPLTPLQEGMLYHTIRAPAAGVFHVQSSAVLDGPLVPEHFARAWELAATRHAVMRTFFAWERRERPLQVVRTHAAISIEHRDWRAVDNQDERWQELMREDRERGLDLANAPLMRLTLVRVTPNRHRLLWSMHHALIDGWSALVVLDEVMRDYATLISGEESTLPAAPRYDRFVGWLETQDAARDEAFWRRTLAALSEPIPLPGGRRSWRSRGERVTTTRVLTAAETQQLHAVAARLRVTVNTLMMGAWALLLARYAGRDDVLFGVSVTERPTEIAEVDRAVGLYLSTLPVRAPAQRGATVGDWLRGLQLALSEARAHGAPGLAAIQRWSGQAPGTPLFESLVVFKNFLEGAMRPFTGAGAEPRGAGGLALSSPAMTVPNDVPLVLFAVPGERLVLDVVHDPAAVPEAVAERLPSQLATLLADFGGDPDRLVDDLTMLGAEERALLLDDWSGAHVVPPPATDVLERFERHAAANPDALALQTESSRVSYATLDRHANRLGQRLASVGIGEGALVGILAERSVEAIAAMLAVLKVGGAYVPLDPKAPAGRLQRMVDSLDAVLAAPQFAPRLPGANTIPLDIATSYSEMLPPRSGDLTSAAYVVFTSGSTGEPKGVVVERGHLAASNAARDAYYPEPPRSFLLLSPITVDSSVAGIFWTLGTGGTLVLPASRAEQDVEALAQLVEQAGVTHTLLVPALYRTLLDHGDARRLVSLRCVIVAGEACPADVVRLHYQRLPGVALHNEYGPSEATVWATAGELSTAAGAGDMPVTIGRPIPGARVYLLDDALRPVPIGSVGELCIGGTGVARGYFGVPDETARRFAADPFHVGGRLYRTGDRARFLADGSIEFLGRGDEQIKIRGFRVEPREIERALGEHPALREAAVAFVRPTPSADPASLAAALAGMTEDAAESLLLAVETVP